MRRGGFILVLLPLLACELCDSPPPTAKDLLGQHVRGRRNFREVVLPSGDFKDARLDNVDLRRANLSHADFTRAILNLTDLSGANLQRANFRGANLRRAILEGADLEGAFYDERTVFPGGFDPDARGMIGPPPKPEPKPEPDPLEEQAKAQAEEWKEWEKLANQEEEPLPVRDPEAVAEAEEGQLRVDCFKGSAAACLAAGLFYQKRYKQGERVSVSVRESFEFLLRACKQKTGCTELGKLAAEADRGIQGVPQTILDRIVRESRALGVGPVKPETKTPDFAPTEKTGRKSSGPAPVTIDGGVRRE